MRKLSFMTAKKVFQERLPNEEHMNMLTGGQKGPYCGQEMLDKEYECNGSSSIEGTYPTTTIVATSSKNAVNLYISWLFDQGKHPGMGANAEVGCSLK